jgi:hypothetical protein
MMSEPYLKWSFVGYSTLINPTNQGAKNKDNKKHIDILFCNLFFVLLCITNDDQLVN